MAGWSLSPLLQALGWATLNSLWQIALLWIIFSFVSSFFSFSAVKKYYTAVAFLLLGFALFAFTFFSFWTNGTSYTLGFVSITPAYYIVQQVVTAAAVCYLLPFFFPAYRLFKNWRFLQKLKTQALRKARLEYRLFVQRTASILGIEKEVRLYLSEQVTSPVTIGFFKPIILLPVAALNRLSLQQTEAVLLHELSHIRRSDYLINWVMTIIYTLLYFNPFVKMFLRTIETERENCCDELVLQFQYDKVSYASALLTLEKNTTQTPVLSMAATGRNFLLRRIEKIVGMEKKVFRFNDVAGLVGAFVCILLLHSFLLTKDSVPGKSENTYSYFTNPLLFLNDEEKKSSPAGVQKARQFWAKAKEIHKAETPLMVEENLGLPALPPADNLNFITVRYNQKEKQLTEEEKCQVASAIDATKKVLHTLPWQEIEKSIADAMTEAEKAAVKKQYVKEVDNTVDWELLCDNLQSQYDKINWEKTNKQLSVALAAIQLDSLQKTYSEMLSQIKQQEKMIQSKTAPCTVAIPDASVKEIKKKKAEVNAQLNKVRVLRTKKIIRI